jgi:hypothetical protein
LPSGERSNDGNVRDQTKVTGDHSHGLSVEKVSPMAATPAAIMWLSARYRKNSSRPGVRPDRKPRGQGCGGDAQSGA